METLLGVFTVGLGGFIMGSGAWPFKLMKKYQFEHWWFIGMLVGLIIMPWTIALLGCPNAIEGLKAVPASALIKANIFAFGWGIANVLCGICFVRIGVALTGAILGGLGVSVGTIVPLVFKGSGLFKDAPGLGSSAGLTILAGVGVMLIGVVFASIAGFGRDRELKKLDQPSGGGFLGGLVMTVIAGILSTGTAFAFVYAQDPIIASLKAVDPSHPETASIPTTFAVFAVSLFAGAVINIAYAIYLLTKNRSWNVIGRSPKEFVLAIIIGVNFSVAVTLMGKGMLLLGALGGSVGWGIQQAMQMTGGQSVGFISGEWKGVGKPKKQMYLAIAILLVAACIMAYGNKLGADLMSRHSFTE